MAVVVVMTSANPTFGREVERPGQITEERNGRERGGFEVRRKNDVQYMY